MFVVLVLSVNLSDLSLIQQIKKDLKKYSKIFEQKDRLSQSKASKVSLILGAEGAAEGSCCLGHDTGRPLLGSEESSDPHHQHVPCLWGGPSGATGDQSWSWNRWPDWLYLLALSSQLHKWWWWDVMSRRNMGTSVSRTQFHPERLFLFFILFYFCFVVLEMGPRTFALNCISPAIFCTYLFNFA